MGPLFGQLLFQAFLSPALLYHTAPQVLVPASKSGTSQRPQLKMPHQVLANTCHQGLSSYPQCPAEQPLSALSLPIGLCKLWEDAHEIINQWLLKAFVFKVGLELQSSPSEPKCSYRSAAVLRKDSSSEASPWKATWILTQNGTDDKRHKTNDKKGLKAIGSLPVFLFLCFSSEHDWDEGMDFPPHNLLTVSNQSFKKKKQKKTYHAAHKKKNPPLKKCHIKGKKIRNVWKGNKNAWTISDNFLWLRNMWDATCIFT